VFTLYLNSDVTNFVRRIGYKKYSIFNLGAGMQYSIPKSALRSQTAVDLPTDLHVTNRLILCWNSIKYTIYIYIATAYITLRLPRSRWFKHVLQLWFHWFGWEL